MAKLIKRPARWQWRRAALYAFPIAAVGVFLVVRLFAATAPSSFEPENGALSTPATKATVSGASGGSVLTFGRPSTDFVHPGILLDKPQLDFVKAKIAAKAEPWYGAYNTMLAGGSGSGGKFSSLTYDDQPAPAVKCVGASGDKSLNVACQAQTDDAIAAHTDALIWYYSGNTAYAQKAISIMNNWSSTLTCTSSDSTTKVSQCIYFDSTYVNGLLNAGWSGVAFTQAAEIIRYSNAGWAQSGIAAFESMLNKAYLPLVHAGWDGLKGAPNWLSLLSNATMDIGIFTNNRANYNLGVSQWRTNLVPAMIYETTDPTTWAKLAGNTAPAGALDGYEGETCRDTGHASAGLDSLMSQTLTAHLQGTDLTTANLQRLVDGSEFNARYFKQQYDTGGVPSWLCGGKITTNVSDQTGWEAGYHLLHDVLGQSMPYTKAWLDGHTRPGTYNAGDVGDWEQLTLGGS